MRAVVLTGFGGTEMLHHESDWPDPIAGDGQLRVRVTACGVNNTDIWTRLGAYGTGADPSAAAGPRRRSIAFPRIQGADAVGVVESVGPGVDAGLIGKRVLVDPVIRDSPDDLLTARYLGSDLDGGFAEFVVVPRSNVLELPDGLDDAHASTLATAAGTAIRMIERAGLPAGSRVVVTGATGGVGTSLVQIASALGFDVTAATRRLHLTDRIAELGAHRVVDPSAITEEDAFDGAFDVVAGPGVPRLLASLRRGGTYVNAGASGGAVMELDMRSVYLGHLSVLGTSLFTASDLRAALDLVARGKLTPVLDTAYPLDLLADAQRHFTQLPRFGNLAVLVG
jgi:NADPH:quinone reductase-like Zn-dependent oxidoreductase